MTITYAAERNLPVKAFIQVLHASGLTVDAAFQGRGIGKRLPAETVKAAPGVRTYLLVSAPGATTFYEAAGHARHPDAFLFHSND